MVAHINQVRELRLKLTTKRATLQVNEEVHTLARQYSEVTGIPISTVVNRALKDWFENVGAAQIEAFSQPLALTLAPVTFITDHKRDEN